MVVTVRYWSRFRSICVKILSVLVRFLNNHALLISAELSPKLAQTGEQQTGMKDVPSSIPTRGNFLLYNLYFAIP